MRHRTALALACTVLAAGGTATAAYAANLPVGAVTGGHMDCTPAAPSAAELARHGARFDALAPAQKLPDGSFRWSDLTGTVTTAFQGTLRSSTGFSLVGKDGTRLDELKPSGAIPAGTLSAAPRLTRPGQPADVGAHAEVLRYAALPSSISGGLQGLTGLHVKVGKTPMALTDAGAASINRAFGTGLKSGTPFLECTADVQARPA